MTIIYDEITDAAAYGELLFNLISKVEATIPKPYVLKGEDHIGIGFNIEFDPARNAVILAMGINPARDGLSARRLG